MTDTFVNVSDIERAKAEVEALGLGLAVSTVGGLGHMATYVCVEFPEKGSKSIQQALQSIGYYKAGRKQKSNCFAPLAYTEPTTFFVTMRKELDIDG